MTEAKKWIEEQDFLWLSVTETERLIKAYEAGATRETALLSQHIIELQKDKGNLTDRCKELEQQIEKMKSDVKQGLSYWNSCDMQYDLYQRLLDKWEIKEK